VGYVADTHGMEPTVLRPRFGRVQLPAGRSEEELVARVHAGDDSAFEALYDTYHRRLLAFCQHMLGSREEAEDALQHTFLAAYRSLRAGYEVVDLKPWLYTIARNRCLSVVRARREELELDDGAPATDGFAAEVDRRADLRMLVRDVQRLPPDQRAALVLFEVGDHSHKEIAAVLGVRREKVKALVFQAREALMGWRTARETPCAHVREELATLRGRALGRGTIRRHVELCSGCADYEAAVRYQRAALAIALPVAPAAGLRAAVLGSTAAGSGLGGAVGVGGATSAAGGLAGLGLNGVAAKVLLVTALVGGAGAAHQATDQPPPRREISATPAPRATPASAAARPTGATPAAADPAGPVRLVAASAAAEHPATRPVAGARNRRDVAPAARRGHAERAATGKTAAPGQLKAPGTPAQGKALGSGQSKAHAPKSARVDPGRGSSATKPAKAKADATPAKPPEPPKPVKAVKAPEEPPAPEAAAPATPDAAGQSLAVAPGEARQQDEPPKKP
jgi:RNA polymerase sigma factor (sigma-70 family)